MNDQQVSFIGQVLADRYLVERKLGQGGVGTTYRAEDRQAGRPVAIKVFNAMVVPEADATQRMLADAQTAANLVSPNLVPTLDAGVHAERFAYIVEPLLVGSSLERRFEQGPLPPANAVRVAIELLAALEVLHRADVLHLDIKPSNVFLVADPLGMERAVLGGVGTHHVLALDQAPAKAKGNCLARPEYIAPEVVSGKPLDAGTDIYLVGLLLYEMLTGRPPFPGTNFKATARRHALEKPVSPRLVRPQARIPDDLDAVVMQCLEKSRKRRFTNATALARALETLAQAGFSNSGTGHRFQSTGGPTAAEAARAATSRPPTPAPAAKVEGETDKAAAGKAAADKAAAEKAAADKAAADKAAADKAAADKAAADKAAADKAAADKAAADKAAADKAAADKAAADKAAADKAAADKAAADKAAADKAAADKAAADKAAAEKAAADKAAEKKAAADKAAEKKAAEKASAAEKKAADKASAADKKAAAEKASAAAEKAAAEKAAAEDAEAEVAAAEKAAAEAARLAEEAARKSIEIATSGSFPAAKPSGSKGSRGTQPGKKRRGGKKQRKGRGAASKPAAPAPTSSAFGAGPGPKDTGPVDVGAALDTAPDRSKPVVTRTAPAAKAQAPSTTGRNDDWFVETTEQLEEKHSKLSVYHFHEEEERNLFPWVMGALLLVVGGIFLSFALSDDPAPPVPDAEPVVTAVGAKRDAAPKPDAAPAPKDAAPATRASPPVDAGGPPPDANAAAAKAEQLRSAQAKAESALAARRWDGDDGLAKAIAEIRALDAKSALAGRLGGRGRDLLVRESQRLEKTGDFAGARAAAQKALVVLPADPAAQRQLEAVRAAESAALAALTEAEAEARAKAEAEAAKAEAERTAASAKAEAERKKAEAAAEAKAEAERKAAQAAAEAKAEAERKALASATAKAEAERKKAAAAAKREEDQRKAAEAKKARAEARRQAAEEKKRKKAEQKAAQAAARKKQAEERAKRRAAAAKFLSDGRGHANAGRWSAARQAYLEATKADPSSSAGFAGLSKVAFQEQKFPEAVRHGKRAVGLASGNADYRVQLGLAHFKLGQYAEAKKVWEVALRLKPGHPTATKYMKVVNKRLGG